MSEPGSTPNAPARYSIGIDLGTTHCALAFVEHSGGDAAVAEVLALPQLTAPGTTDALALLPSFLYLPHPAEFADGELALPWNPRSADVVGEFARRHGAQTPTRLVSSAKSWLGHAGADRRGAILPPDAPAEVQKVSPLEASTRYLAHLRDAWNAAHPDAPFGDQDVTVTIPASFDPVARELTAQAAAAAGCVRLTLLEEPQAALYSWLHGSAGGWREQVRPGDVILVVDVGGGTSDFSLVGVSEADGNLALQRVAVGDHILLGGDNMDLALTHVVNRKLAADGKTLDAWQLRALTHACRAAKETLLGGAAPAAVPLVVPSRSSKLIGASLRTELTRDEVTQTLVDGFFPAVASDARPLSRPRTGLTQIGLPYAQDAAVTRHLAALLGRQLGATADLTGFAPAASPGAPVGADGGARFLHPTALLVNGGVFKSALLVERLRTTLDAWLAADGAAPLRLLEGADLDLAVARGAAYYGVVRQGRGMRIRGGTASAYYVGIESSMPAIPGLEPPIQALCVAPFGIEEGSDAEAAPQEFGLVVGEAVRFRFFASSVRRHDRVGSLLDAWPADELQELDEIEMTLPAEGHAPGDVVPVTLQARVTETGTLELAAVPRGGAARWKVEYEVRDRGSAA